VEEWTALGFADGSLVGRELGLPLGLSDGAMDGDGLGSFVG
jgi:hypothetical protein